MLRFRTLLILVSLTAGTASLKAGLLYDCPDAATLACHASVMPDIFNLEAEFQWEATAPGRANFSFTSSYLTAGPPRPGFMVLTMWHGGENYGPYSDSSWAIAFDGFGCSGSAPGFVSCFNDSFQSVMLGTIFNLSLNAEITAAPFSDPFFYLGGGSSYTRISAAFYESVAGAPLTPVGVTQAAIPEPRGILLLASGLLAMWGAGRLGRRRGMD